MPPSKPGCVNRLFIRRGYAVGMKRLSVLLVAALLWVAPAVAQEMIDVVAFGSCAKQNRPQPVWAHVLGHEPDLFLLIGDNVYADTEDEAKMRAAYAKLGAQPGFAKLRQAVPVLATWDDHDYGENDAGAEYPARAMSRRVFCDFFGIPEDDPRRKREGVYHAQTIGPEGRRVQIILLDTRYHRSPLKRGVQNGRKAWVPDDDPAKTMLGAAQWQWLEAKLRQPAEVRIIASSIQVVAEQHRFEKWANLPHERRRLFDLIERTGAQGVVFISGDRHLAECSVDHEAGPYPMVDLTSSGLNEKGDRVIDEPNRHRVGGPAVRTTNFGLIRIDWNTPSPTITLEARDGNDRVRVSHRVTLDALR